MSVCQNTGGIAGVINEESSNLQNTGHLNKPSWGEFRLPELEFPQQSDISINFQIQSYKLSQANTILTELIKQTLLEKYRLNEKILQVAEQIKKMQIKNNK